MLEVLIELPPTDAHTAKLKSLEDENCQHEFIKKCAAFARQSWQHLGSLAFDASRKIAEIYISRLNKFVTALCLAWILS